MKKYVLAVAVSIILLILLPACAGSKDPVDSVPPAAEGTEVPPSAEATEEVEKTELSEQRQKAAKYMEDQKAAEAAIQAELENGYTFEDPLVVVNPYSLSPLSAAVGFDTDQETRIDVTVKGKDANADISHSFEESSTRHLLPICGLYAGYDNTVELTATTRDGQSRTTVLTIRTDALPDDISQVEVRAAAPEKMAAGLTFFDCPHINGNYFLAIDCNGDIRWYFGDKSFNGAVMLTHLQNGNMLIGSGDVIPNSYNNLTGAYEITPLGKFAGEYHVYGTHHDIRETGNGNLIFLASKEGAESQNDYIVEIDRETGETARSWDLMEIIPMTAYDTQEPYTGGLSNWLHNNAVWYIEEEDSFIISGRHQNMVMKFDASTNEIKWILSATVGELNEKLRPYLLQPEGAEFEYPTSQHAAMQTPEGDLMLFDNRNFEEQNEDGTLNQDLLYSRAVRYEIDEEHMTVKQVWQYGQERGTELFSSFISDVDYLGADHYLINFGGMYKLEDGSSYDHVLSSNEEKNSAMKQAAVIELVNDEVVFEALLHGGSNSNAYKAERKNIYQNARELVVN